MAYYRRGLLLFLNRYGDLASQLLPWLEEGEFEKIYHLNHTLKGAAGNLAMSEAFMITTAIEAALHEHCTEDLPNMLSDLINAVEKLKPEIKLLLLEQTEVEN